MKTLETISVERANEIQALWMALDSSHAEKHKQMVFKAMKELPQSYLSISSDGLSAVAMVQGSPVCMKMTLGECIKYHGDKVSDSLAWQCDKWISI